MRRVALASTLLALALTTASCSGDGTSQNTGDTGDRTSGKQAAEGAEATSVAYDNTLDVSSVKVAPGVSESFTKVDIANAKTFVERWVSDLVTRPEDILHSGKGGYAPENFAHLRPYISDEFWDSLMDLLPSANRSDLVTRDVPGATSTKPEDRAHTVVRMLNGLGVNGPGGLLAETGLIEPKISDIQVSGTEYPTAAKVDFTTTYHVEFNVADRKVARGLTKDKDVPPGTDGARVETDRSIWIYRESPGEPWRTYTWSGRDIALDYVVLAEALDS